MLEHTVDPASDPSRIVLLGAAGFVGGAIRRRVQQAGLSLLPLSSRDLDLVPADAAPKLSATLADGDSVVLVSAIVPCKDGSSLIRNLRMIENVCSALEGHEIAQLIYISSDAVYSDRDELITEDSAAAPQTLHGAMHRTRELLLTASVRAPVAVLRPSLLFGPGDPHNGYGPNRFRRSAAKDQRITLFGEGEEKRDHVFISDVAEIVLRCLRCRSQGVLNIASGRSASFRVLAELVAALFESSIELVPTPRRSPITHRHFDISGTLKAFPEFRFTALEEALRHTHLAEREGS
ncbi:MAG: NAD-dependent epimerase/dehydratase family protein [Myxococcota bacterium]